MTMKTRILVVEDDSALARVLSDNLAFEGYDVAWAASGTSAVDKVRAFAPDLIVLDIMLPGKSGFELFGLLGQGGRIPIVVLTARSQRTDKLKGLYLGADDYVTKPFDLEELLARIQAVLRRSRPAVEGVVLGDVSIDFRAMVARQGSRVVHLTHREFELLRYLAQRQEHVVHRDELLRAVWGYPDA